LGLRSLAPQLHVSFQNMNNQFNIKYPLLDALIFHKGNNWGEKYDERQTQELSKKHSALVSSSTGLSALAKVYFGSRLHDSWIEGINYQNRKLEIKFNEFTSHCFVDAICDEFELNIPHKNRVIPVTLSFLNLHHLSISRINGNNKIIPLSKQKFIPKLSEYLYDQIIFAESGKIVAGILFYTGLKGNKSYLLLELCCEEVEIIEAQREAFHKLLKGNYVEIFDLYWKKKQVGNYFDYSVAKKLIEENRKNQPLEGPRLSTDKGIRER